MLTAVRARLRALSPLQVALVILAAFVLVGSSTAVAQKLITGSDIEDRSVAGRDIARATVTHVNLKNETVLSQDIRDGHVLSRDIQDGAVSTSDLSPDVRARLAGGSGGNGTTGKDGQTGATGPQGAPGAVGAPGAFVVQDANGTTAGTLLTLTTAATADPTISFYFNGHSFRADAFSGALELPVVGLYYTQPGCAGTAYYPPWLPVQAAVRSEDTGDTNIYEYSGGPPAALVVGSVYQAGFGGCFNQSFTTQLAEMEVLSAGDTPPTLTGPLRFVPAD